MRVLTFAAISLAFCACASLNLRPTDGGGMIGMKVTARALICVPTLCISELALAAKRARERYTTEENELTARVERSRRAAIQADNDADRRLALLQFDSARVALEQLHHPNDEPHICESRVIGSEVVTPCE